MKKNKCLYFSAWILILAITLSSFGMTAAAANIDYSDLDVSEPKILCEATIDEDFSDNRVMVVMNHDASMELKEYTTDDFSEINAKDITDLASSTREKATAQLEVMKQAFINRASLNVEELVSYKEYNQVICLELEDTGKDKVLEAIELLQQREDVIYVGPDYAVYLSSTTPDDTHYELQSDYADLIQLPEAWDITTGSSSVKVGIIDTGINGSHPDLIDSVNVVWSRDLTDGAYDTVDTVIDVHGRGTNVAGIIGARGDNGIGMSGVCWDVTLVSLKAFNENRVGYAYNVAMAVNYADSRNIPILNLSFCLSGAQYNYPPLERTIQNYFGLVVCAAGDDKQNNPSNIYPANYSLSNLITVGASNENDERWLDSNGISGSNYGISVVDIFAPGDEVLATTNSLSYATVSGTAYATAYVTGVAALLLSIHPELTAAQLKQIIMNSVDVVYDDDGNNVFGNLCVSGGRLNTYKALKTTSIHSFDEVNSGNAYTHNYACVDCGYVLYTEAHTLSLTHNGNASTHNYTCSDCGYVASTEEHSFVCENVNYEHIVICEDCNYIPPRAITYLNQGVSSGHTARCSNCSYSATESHDWTDLSGSYRCLKCNVTTTTIPGIMSWEDEEETE